MRASAGSNRHVQLTFSAGLIGKLFRPLHIRITTKRNVNASYELLKPLPIRIAEPRELVAFIKVRLHAETNVISLKPASNRFVI